MRKLADVVDPEIEEKVQVMLSASNESLDALDTALNNGPLTWDATVKLLKNAVSIVNEKEVRRALIYEQHERGFVQEMSRNVDDTKAKVTGLESQVSGIIKHLITITQDSHQVETLSVRVKGLEEKVDGLSHTVVGVPKMGQEITTLGGQVISMVAKLDQLLQSSNSPHL